MVAEPDHSYVKINISPKFLWVLQFQHYINLKTFYAMQHIWFKKKKIADFTSGAGLIWLQWNHLTFIIQKNRKASVECLCGQVNVWITVESRSWLGLPPVTIILDWYCVYMRCVRIRWDWTNKQGRMCERGQGLSYFKCHKVYNQYLCASVAAPVWLLVDFLLPLGFVFDQLEWSIYQLTSTKTSSLIS